jgi:hypothetical protein
MHGLKLRPGSSTAMIRYHGRCRIRCTRCIVHAAVRAPLMVCAVAGDRITDAVAACAGGAAVMEHCKW